MAGAPIVPADIMGCPIREEVHWRGGRGLRVFCPVHGHKCNKYRSLNLDLHAFGLRAAEIYLSTWLSKAHSMDI
eukprot:7551502-Pyramimonas_sp.AAC.1